MKTHRRSKGSQASPRRRLYRAAGRERQKRETRTRILDSAIKLFSERGFDAASVRDISAAAGVTHAVIRLHFGSKEQLWRAAIDRLFERQDEEVGLDVGQANEPLRPERLRAYVRYCARHPEHVRIMVQESLRDTERVRWLAKTHIARLQAPFVRRFKKARKECPLAAFSIPSMLYSMVAASQMVFALGAEVKHVYGLDVNDPAFIAAHADTVCRIVLGVSNPDAQPPTNVARRGGRPARSGR